MSETNVFDVLSDKILNKIENSGSLTDMYENEMQLDCHHINLIKMIDGIEIYAIIIYVRPNIDDDVMENEINMDDLFKDIDIRLTKPLIGLQIIVKGCDNWYINSSNSITFDKESIIEGLKYCFDKLKKAKFNKYLCCLEYDEITNEINIDNLLCEYLMIDTDNKFKIKGDDCCVCMERTITKTRCNHFICLPCFQKIKIRKCPICRDDLLINLKHD